MLLSVPGGVNSRSADVLPPWQQRRTRPGTEDTLLGFTGSLSAPLYSFIDRQTNLLQSAASATVFPLWSLSSSGAAQQPVHLCGPVQCEREQLSSCINFQSCTKKFSWYSWKKRPVFTYYKVAYVTFLERSPSFPSHPLWIFSLQIIFCKLFVCKIWR